MNKKHVWGLIVLAVIIVGGILIYNHTHNKNTETYNSTNQTSSNSPTASSTSDQNNTASSTSGSGTTKKLSYAQAIATYKERFQFSQCHGNPGIISVRLGTPVMLDNRDSIAHTIKADGQTVRIAGYDYAVIYTGSLTRNQTDLTTTNIADSNITCDGGGAGTLNVQK